MTPQSAIRKEPTSSPLLEAKSEVDSTPEKKIYETEIIAELLRRGANVEAKNNVCKFSLNTLLLSPSVLDSTPQSILKTCVY